MTRSIGHSGAKPIMMQNFVSLGILPLAFQLLKFFFRKLIESCSKFGIEFVFSVSPGLSMSFSSQADYGRLLAKFEQIKQLGCRSFAVLWDDINAELQGNDAVVYQAGLAFSIIFGWKRKVW